jgi:hypothetical protein
VQKPDNILEAAPGVYKLAGARSSGPDSQTPFPAAAILHVVSVAELRFMRIARFVYRGLAVVLRFCWYLRR